MVTFVDPRAEPGAEVEPYTQSVDTNAGPSIALVANGFPDSEEFLLRVEKALTTRLPAARFVHWNKRNASATLRDDMVDDIAANCDAAVGAYGH